jgi:hypothetical protein
VGLVTKTPASPYVGERTLRWLKVMKRPQYREGASGWEPFGVATSESPRPPNTIPEEDPELYRGSLYEPPYSIWEAAVGFTVIVIGSLLSRWLRGQ